VKTLPKAYRNGYWEIRATQQRRVFPHARPEAPEDLLEHREAVLYVTRSQKEEEVGRVEATYINLVGAPWPEGDLFEIFDSENQDLYEIWEALRAHRADLLAYMGENSTSGVLYVQKVRIIKDLRGYGLGGPFFDECLGLIGSDAEYAVLTAKPQDQEPGGEVSTQRLMGFYSRYGFDPIGDTNHMLKGEA